MIKLNFIEDRSSSAKWLGTQEGMIGMGLAEMDVAPPNCIFEAIQNHIAKLHLGYPILPDAYDETIRTWHNRDKPRMRDQHSILPNSGTLNSIKMLLHGNTVAGDKVLIFEPLYQCIKQSIIEAKREPVIHELDAENDYNIDFDQLESACRKGVRAMVLCSPHNPIGKIWSPYELSRLIDLCRMHQIFMISDEVHSEFNLSSMSFVSIAEVCVDTYDRWAVLGSPTKTFNISGLRGGFVIVPKSQEAKLVDNMRNYGSDKLNTLHIVASIAGYRYGYEWFQSVLELLRKNHSVLSEALRKDMPLLQIFPLQGTYMAWVNLGELNDKKSDFMQLVLRKVLVTPGITYGSSGADFFRINIACATVTLIRALAEIKHAYDLCCGGY